MKRLQFALLSMVSIGLIDPQVVSSNIVSIENPSGKSLEFGIDSNDRFFDVLNRIQLYLQEDPSMNEGQEIDPFAYAPERDLTCDFAWNLMISNEAITARAKEIQGRNYKRGVTKEEKSHISFIVKTLAYDDLISVGKKKSELKSRGEEIKSVHPLCFLKVVFSQEELKAGIAAIRGRISWIRDGFFDGIYESMGEESSNKNMLPFLSDFSKFLNVEEASIRPYIEKKQWKEFIKALIDLIPREIDPNRYDM